MISKFSLPLLFSINFLLLSRQQHTTWGQEVTIESVQDLKDKGGLVIPFRVPVDTGALSLADTSVCVLQYHQAPFGVGCEFDATIPSLNMTARIEVLMVIFDLGDPRTYKFEGKLSLPTPQNDILLATPTTWPVEYDEHWTIYTAPERRLGYCLPMDTICGLFCFETRADGGQGEEADLVAELTIFGTEGESALCSAARNSGLAEPIVVELDLAQILYLSLLNGQTEIVNSREPSLVSLTGFQFFQSSLKPTPLPDAEVTMALPTNTIVLDVSGTSFRTKVERGGCDVTQSTEPWLLHCTTSISLEHGKAAMNNGAPLLVHLNASAVINPQNEREFMDVRLGMHIPAISIALDGGRSLNFEELILEEDNIVLTKEQATHDVCLARLTDYFSQVSAAGMDAQQIASRAHNFGLDVCFQLDGSMGGDGGEIGIGFEFRMLDVDKASPAARDLVQQAWAVLGLNGQFVVEMDLGKLFLENNSEEADGLVARNGRFEVGTRLDDKQNNTEIGVITSMLELSKQVDDKENADEIKAITTALNTTNDSDSDSDSDRSGTGDAENQESSKVEEDSSKSSTQPRFQRDTIIIVGLICLIFALAILVGIVSTVSFTMIFLSGNVAEEDDNIPPMRPGSYIV